MKHERIKPRPRWRDGLVNPRPVPDDFEATFVKIGRLECETHYRVGRFVIDHWLERSGKQRLIDARAAFVHKRQEDQRRAESLRELAKCLSRSYPVKDRRRVKPGIARAAAKFLRIVRNGGMIISPTNEGDWRVGTRRMSAAQLLDLAKARGFKP